MIKFWQRVDSLLTQGQTLKWLCDELGVNYRSVLNLRTNKRLPPLDIGVQIAKYLGTSVEYLLTGEELYHEPEPEKNLDQCIEATVEKILKKHGLIK